MKHRIDKLWVESLGEDIIYNRDNELAKKI